MAAPLRQGYWPRSTWSTFPPFFLQVRYRLSPAPAASAYVVSTAGGNANNPCRFSSASRSRPCPSTSSSPTSSVLFRAAVSLQSTRGLRLPGDASTDSDSEDDASILEGPTKKSRNQLKREARRAVRWGMDLAEFASPHIKRILRVPGLRLGSLEEDIYDALMLLKKIGPDVREGKRRQFNYIGRLLRDAELPDPELLDDLIQASKDHDNSKFQALSGQETWTSEDEEEEEEFDSDEENQSIMDTTTRWYNGLISKDSAITKEVYSLYDVEFNRQELRKLVRKIQTAEGQMESEESGDNTALTKAKGSLLSFLRRIARQTSLVA